MDKGRPKTVTDKMKKMVIEKRKEGLTIKEVSNALSFPLTTVWMILHEAGLSGKQSKKSKEKSKETGLSKLPDTVLFKHEDIATI